MDGAALELLEAPARRLGAPVDRVGRSRAHAHSWHLSRRHLRHQSGSRQAALTSSARALVEETISPTKVMGWMLPPDGIEACHAGGVALPATEEKASMEKATIIGICSRGLGVKRNRSGSRHGVTLLS